MKRLLLLLLPLMLSGCGYALVGHSNFLSPSVKTIEVPVLVVHGDDDQIVPYADSGPLSAALLRNDTLKTYEGLPHGLPTTHADILNRDLLAFIRGDTLIPTEQDSKIEVHLDAPTPA